MADSVTVSSHHSYGSRVGNSLKAIVWWFILVWVSIRLLSWNEKNYVEEKAALDEWAKIVQEATSDKIDPNLEWMEIHLYWETASDAEPLKDDTFWVTTDDLKLKRTVEMYQWYQDEDTDCHDNLWWGEDCNTTYSYHKEWSENAISSSNFNQSSDHENPSNREYKSSERSKSPITLWAYTLAPIFVSKLTNYEPINLSNQNINIPENYREIVNQKAETNEITSVEENNNSYLYGDSQNDTQENNNQENTTTTSNERFHISENQIYIWKNINEPAVWDLRITYSSVKPWNVSIVWKQMGNQISENTVKGRSINLLEQWNVSAADMFLHEQQANKRWTWILRFLWLFLMYCWFAAMFNFIETIAKVIPFLAKIIWVWTSIIALWLTLIVWFLTIWIAWLAVRPIIWIWCLVVAAGGIFLLIKSKKNKKSNLPEEKIEEKPEPIEQPKE